MNELARMDNNSSEINLLINEFEKTIAQVIQVMAYYSCNVADPGCLSRIFLSRIPDPNFFHPGSAEKNLSIVTQKIVSELSEI